MAKIKVTLKKSQIGSTEKMRKNIQSLGLRKINSSAIHEDNESIRGMIHVVRHLVAVEDVAE
ncbi:50S ribosomal protein L30 [Eubacteriales bacterium OttesenSCG-928-M02]|nr:50S ribosomal protein L30 [Eubacteriales bacterium OttesenSCG-928-M02]